MVTADLRRMPRGDTPRPSPVAATDVFDEQFKAADDEVAHIIAANLGRNGKAAVAVASPKVSSQPAVQAQKHASAPAQPAVQSPVVQ